MGVGVDVGLGVGVGVGVGPPEVGLGVGVGVAVGVGVGVWVGTTGILPQSELHGFVVSKAEPDIEVTVTTPSSSTQASIVLSGCIV